MSIHDEFSTGFELIFSSHVRASESFLFITFFFFHCTNPGNQIEISSGTPSRGAPSVPPPAAQRSSGPTVRSVFSHRRVSCWPPFLLLLLWPTFQPGWRSLGPGGHTPTSVLSLSQHMSCIAALQLHTGHGAFCRYLAADDVADGAGREPDGLRPPSEPATATADVMPALH